MEQDFIIGFDYFNNRSHIFDLLGELADRHSINKLRGFQIFVNNIPTSLELYAYLSYDSNANQEIEHMKELLFSVGEYRPDLSLSVLINRIGNRGFNSFGIIDSKSVKSIISDFWFKSRDELPDKQTTERHIQRLKLAGYNAFQTLAGGTTFFISHSSKQKEEIEKIMPYFTSVNELIWLDKFRIKPDQDDETIKREIITGLDEANTVLFFITEDFLNSSWCIMELELSLKHYTEKQEYTLLFIIISEIKELFFSKYPLIVDKIAEENMLVLNNQKLENEIGIFINQKGNRLR